MASPFINVRFIAVEKTAEELEAVGAVAPGVHGLAPEGATFATTEEAARFYLGKVLGTDERPSVRGFAGATGTAQAAPDVRLRSELNSSATDTKLVRFEQERATIPIFGSHVLVELDRARNLVALDADVAAVEGVTATPGLSAEQALASVARLLGVGADAIAPATVPELTFFHDDEAGKWHLAYFFRRVPGTPPGSGSHGRGHGLGRSPRDMRRAYDYLVDAHDGAVLFFYSAAPTAGALPSECRGVDELDTEHVFFGRVAAGGFELNDPMRRLKTFDLTGRDIDTPTGELPGTPIRSASANLGKTSRAAVSAHVNAGRVQDFFRSVLMRNSIDDQGMELLSMVNCTYQEDEDPPEWRNAMWWNGRMWYGQVRRSATEFKSFSAYLDIIGHELTHGVTETSSDLVYKNESGALNESFSDIFGVIINNWFVTGADSDVDGWDWEIGKGLGNDGLPLRDFAKPSRTHDPDHMDGYLKTKEDEGGVHTNSNIHNKAAHRVLTARAGGVRVFKPSQVALLYYLCLLRLPKRATFGRTARVLLDVAGVVFAGDAALKKRAIAAIKEAYADTGITPDPA